MDDKSVLIPQIKPEIPEAQNKESKVVSGTSKSKIDPLVWWGVGIFFGLLLLALIIPGIFVYKDLKDTYSSAKSLETALSSQNFETLKSELGRVKENLLKLSNSYRFLIWLKAVPFLGSYWEDGNHAIKGGIYGIEAGEVILTTIEPYSDLLGFTTDPAKQAKSGEETAQDRIEFVVSTIESIIPKLDEVSQKVSLANGEYEKINPERYPETFAGKKVRGNLRVGLEVINQATAMITGAKPLLEQAPYLLGIEGERTYLVLFQNDKELRPTGGFITAYSIMKVKDGKFSPVSSNDIYNLDTRYRPVIPAPDFIIKYIRGPYILSKNIRLRDMNFDPDFASSMELFTKEAQKVGIRNIDGVIAVDTHVLAKILDVLGEIGVPGFGNFSTKIIPKCNCPQVIYELESFADIEGPIVWDPNTGKIVYKPPHSDNRKAIVGPLMNSIMTNALGQPKEKIPLLFEALFESLVEKHILFYMLEEKAQAAVESFNIAGRVREFNGDYLHINDSNLGGRKSNLYVTQEVEQEISVAKDGTVEKSVIITYNNPEKYDGWLNSVLPNWVRIYVPKGSELIDFEGVENKKDPYEENGKIVFAGFFELRPQGIVKVKINYKLPFKVKGMYKLLVQKQPGTNNPLYVIRLGKIEDERFLMSDKEFNFDI